MITGTEKPRVMVTLRIPLFATILRAVWILLVIVVGGDLQRLRAPLVQLAPNVLQTEGMHQKAA